MSTEFDPLHLLRVLHRHDVDFVVIGGIAAVLHGSARATFDLDVTFATDRANLEALERARDDLGADVRHLDVLARPAGAPPFDTLRRRADRYDVGGFTVRVASVEDLMAMKRAAGRPKDLADLAELTAILRLRS